MRFIDYYINNVLIFLAKNKTPKSEKVKNCALIKTRTISFLSENSTARGDQGSPGKFFYFFLKNIEMSLTILRALNVHTVSRYNIIIIDNKYIQTAKGVR